MGKVGLVAVAGVERCLDQCRPVASRTEGALEAENAGEHLGPVAERGERATMELTLAEAHISGDIRHTSPVPEQLCDMVHRTIRPSGSGQSSPCPVFQLTRRVIGGDKRLDEPIGVPHPDHVTSGPATVSSRPFHRTSRHPSGRIHDGEPSETRVHTVMPPSDEGRSVYADGSGITNMVVMTRSRGNTARSTVTIRALRVRIGADTAGTCTRIRRRRRSCRGSQHCPPLEAGTRIDCDRASTHRCVWWCT